MSKIGSNIRKIRTVKGLSQAAFANLFNLKRANIGAYEEMRAEPKIDVVIAIANYFSIPLNDIFTKDLTVNQLTNFHLSESMKAGALEHTMKGQTKLNFVSAELVMNRPLLFARLRKEPFLDQISFPNIIENADTYIEVKGLFVSGAKNLHAQGLICKRIKEGKPETIILALSDKEIVLGAYLSGKEKVIVRSPETQSDTTIKDVKIIFQVQLIIAPPARSAANLSDRLTSIEAKLRSLEDNQ